MSVDRSLYIPFKVMPASSLHTSVWVTDMACLPRFHFLVFATTARDIQFYDTNANRFVRLSRITGLNACPTALNFHESRWSTAKLLWGDQVCLSRDRLWRVETWFDCRGTVWAATRTGNVIMGQYDNMYALIHTGMHSNT